MVPWPLHGLPARIHSVTKFHIHSLSRRNYSSTVLWSIFLCLLIVVAASALGRAAHNFKAALTDKPDVAIYLLLPDKNLGNTTLLRESPNERDYLAETASGPLLVRLKKGEEEWFVSFTEPLHGDALQEAREAGIE
jgi:hypothetical protein